MENNFMYNENFQRRRYIPRIFRLSYLMSFFIPNRQHYCDKCNNYLEHMYTSKWKNQINPGSSCNKKCNCQR